MENLFDSLQHRNNKFIYYSKSVIKYVTPKHILWRKLPKIIAEAAHNDGNYIEDRVNYYNNMDFSPTCENMEPLKHFKYPKRQKGKPSRTAYFFDLYEYTRFFDDLLKISYLFGDITNVPHQPSIVKSRPLVENNQNSILLNLNKVRHFAFIRDNKKFENKQNKLVGRAAIYQPHRVQFWEMYFNHPLCDLGQTNDTNDPYRKGWVKKYMSIKEHLNYKFILCLEGNDVASNLKWVMSSNSLAVMPRPKYETWFMEGKLIPNEHYVEIKPDYSDLEERLNYYIEHTDEALKIIENAHKWVNQFKDKKRENLISLLILQKYFRQTAQI